MKRKLREESYKLDVLTEDGYYELHPVDVSDEVKETVKALMKDWRAWAKRMENHDNESMRPSAGTIMICVYEIEHTLKIDSPKQTITETEK